MKPYAHKTAVPVDRTRSEIQSLIEKHGATGFVFGNAQGLAMIVFEMRERRLKFTIPMPVVDRKTTEQKAKAEIRRRWRALLLVLKAKLEAVASNIVAFDVEFLPFVVLPSAMTFGEEYAPRIPEALAGSKLPPLLGP